MIYKNKDKKKLKRIFFYLAISIFILECILRLPDAWMFLLTFFASFGSASFLRKSRKVNSQKLYNASEKILFTVLIIFLIQMIFNIALTIDTIEYQIYSRYGEVWFDVNLYSALIISFGLGFFLGGVKNKKALWNSIELKQSDSPF